MSEPQWSRQDDVAAYAEYVAAQYAWYLTYVYGILVPELGRIAESAAGAIGELVAAIRASEARELGEHSDLAELDVQLTGFYG